MGDPMTEQTVLEIPEMAGLSYPPQRRPQTRRTWPAGTVIVSADSHWLESDIFVDKFPPELKHRAPRVTFVDGGWRFEVDGKDNLPPALLKVLCGLMECVPGFRSPAERLKDLDAEGVDKELLFPQRILALMAHNEIFLRKHLFRAYNQHLAEVCKEAAGRLYFAGIPNFWDPAADEASIAEVKELGASVLLLPLNPRQDSRGNPIHYSSLAMDWFWRAVAQSGLPVAFHIGEKLLGTDMPGWSATQMLVERSGFRQIWGPLVFGGVFDRHPTLKVFFAEAGISWVPGMLHEADVLWTSYGDFLQPRLLHPPSWYWYRHCYASFMTDPPGLALLDRIGVDHVLWSSDYPHPESTFGYTNSAIQAVFDATDASSARKILGGNALELFGMA
jgi:predicted TIM-barrel fold metal-dependent hydrolase